MDFFSGEHGEVFVHYDVSSIRVGTGPWWRSVEGGSHAGSVGLLDQCNNCSF